MNKQIYLLYLILILLLSSCVSQKQLTYFSDLPDSAVVHLPPLPQQPRYIQEGDNLQIDIGAEDPTAAAIFNNYGGVGGLNGASTTRISEVTGFLVNTDGTVELAYVGKIKAAGLTTDELKKILEEKLSKYLKAVVVSVRFYQLKFTVLGEVRAPGTYTLPMQRTTFLDALGAAGDLPSTAKRYDIRVYRDYNGKRTIFKIDLRKKDILYNQELFQVKHNDVIYVQQRDSRLFSDEAKFYVSFLTLVVGIYAIFIRYK